MASIKFEKEANKYVAEIEVSSDFNLHIEKGFRGGIYLYVRTTPTGQFDSVTSFNIANHDSVIDYDFTALVYPKTIRVVSEIEPTVAEITFA